MERVFHKKTELLNFEFINTDDKHITSSKIYGKKFSYIKNENQITIQIDLKNSNDINDLEIFFKELKCIKLDIKHIIKQLEILKELNQNCKYLLELHLSNNVYKKYNLNFKLDGIWLYLNTKYIEDYHTKKN